MTTVCAAVGRACGFCMSYSWKTSVYVSPCKLSPSCVCVCTHVSVCMWVVQLLGPESRGAVVGSGLSRLSGCGEERGLGFVGWGLASSGTNLFLQQTHRFFPLSIILFLVVLTVCVYNNPETIVCV